MPEPRASRGYRRGAQGAARLCLRHCAPQPLFGTLAQARRGLSRLERAPVSPRACALGRRGRARQDRMYEQFQQVREAEGAGARFGMTILVTGGAGFIGSNFVLDWFAQGAGPVINLDKLTYAGNPAN